MAQLFRVKVVVVWLIQSPYCSICRWLIWSRSFGRNLARFVRMIYLKRRSYSIESYLFKLSRYLVLRLRVLCMRPHSSCTLQDRLFCPLLSLRSVTLDYVMLCTHKSTLDVGVVYWWNLWLHVSVSWPIQSYQIYQSTHDISCRVSYVRPLAFTGRMSSALTHRAI